MTAKEMSTDPQKPFSLIDAIAYGTSVVPENQLEGTSKELNAEEARDKAPIVSNETQPPPEDNGNSDDDENSNNDENSDDNENWDDNENLDDIQIEPASDDNENSDDDIQIEPASTWDNDSDISLPSISGDEFSSNESELSSAENENPDEALNTEPPNATEDSSKITLGKRMLEDERIETPQEVVDFIANSQYKQIFVGALNMKKPVHVSLRQKGVMNSAEKDLFDYVNNVLQYPACIRKTSVLIKKETRRVYGYDIAKYVEFLAKNEISVQQFKVDGIFMYMCMQDWVNRRLEKEEMETSHAHSVMNKFKSSMGVLQQLIAIYKLKDCNDEAEYDARYTELIHIPNLHRFDDYSKERLNLRHDIPKENYHNKERLIQARYTIENVRQMMRNRLAETATGGKKAIFDGINARLEFLLGHHYLLRSSNKCPLNLSDSMWDAETVGSQTINVLGFHILEGKTMRCNMNSSKAGALRHKDVDLCFVSAFAMSLWFRFDFEDGPLSGENFPNFLKKSDWYPIKVLFSTGKTRGREQISYRYNNSLVTGTVKSIGFTTIKKTHLGRAVNPQLADASAIEESQIKRAGLWSREVVHLHYMTNYPFEYLKFSAGFDKGETYYISRDVEVPQELQRLIFPWLEKEIHKVENRPDKHESNYLKQDGTIIRFLKMLKAFRSIIIQDLAVMLDQSPESMFTKHEITRHPLFRTFKDSMSQVIADTRESTQMMLVKSLADTAPIIAGKMEAVREVIERQFTSILKVREELKLFREEMKAEMFFLRECWRNEMLPDLKNSLAHDLQYSLRVTVADASASALCHRNMIAEFGTNQIKRHFDEKVSSINDSFDEMKNLLNAMPQLSIADGVMGASTSVSDHPHKKRKVDAAPVIPDEHQKISRQTNSVVSAYHEWYTSHNDFMCFQERDEKYGIAWRKDNPTIGLYKRRRTIDKFIEDQVNTNDNFKNYTKLEFAKILEAFKSRERLRLSALCERLGKLTGRSNVVRDLENFVATSGER